MVDVAVPIVFPDYLIRVETPPVRVDVPNWIPGIPNEVVIPSTSHRVPYLGHAGILFFNSRGLTKYYEYGRYDPAEIGLVRRHVIPDVRIGGDGRPTIESLRTTLMRISMLAGQGGQIVGAYIELGRGAFDRMIAYANTRIRQNTNRRRSAYNLISNSCLHFMRGVAEAGGARMPEVIVPQPVSYIRQVRWSFADLDFNPTGSLTIEGIGLR